MKFNFRKISAIAVSALMTGMTMGVAAAANFPAPFVTGGTANDVAIVYGTGAGVSSLDYQQALDIKSSLGADVDGGAVSVEGGEVFDLDKESDHFNYAEELNGVYESLDDDEMDFLADGDFDDGDVDTTYSQTLTLSAEGEALDLFSDNDYNDGDATIGFKWADGSDFLSYEIEFDDAIPYADLEGTDMPLLGQEYYVLDVNAANTTITLLDSANKVTIYEGETKVVGENEVSIYSIDSNGVRFTVNAVNTEKLGEHEYEEVEDDVFSHLLVDSFNYDTRDGKDSFAEVSIGAGKIELIDGEDIEINDEDVDGLVADFDQDDLTSLTITWSADEESFLTAEDALTMPLFETVSLVFGGMNFPEEPEEYYSTSGEKMELQMGNYNLPLFWIDADGDDALGHLGEEYNQLITNGSANLLVNLSGEHGVVNYTGVLNWTAGMEVFDGDRFIITIVEDDLTDIDTYYYEVKDLGYDDDEVDLLLEDLLGDKDIEFDTDGLTDVESGGDLLVTIKQINNTQAFLNFSITGKTISYNTVISEKGLKVTLPVNTTNQVLNYADGVSLVFAEADIDDDVGEGTSFLLSVKNNSDEDLHVSSTNLTSSFEEEEEDSDEYVAYVPSDLTTKLMHDKSADIYGFSIEYYGEEVTADVQVVGGASTVSTGDAVLGDVVFLDTETTSYADKNVIVVGGSCINSAAAALVGGAKCGAAWTAATTVGQGQFLIKGYAESDITSEFALLVAGYEAADTVKATTALLNEEIDTSKTTVGTTSTGETTVLN